MEEEVREEDDYRRIYKHELAEVFTPNKVKKAIDSFGKHKAPGLDNIRPVALQSLDNKTIERLRNLFNACILLKYVPKTLTKSKLIFIPKVGKDLSDSRSQRPITLSSFVFKTMERVIYWTLEEGGHTDKIHGSQNAYRRGKSTETALAGLFLFLYTFVSTSAY